MGFFDKVKDAFSNLSDETVRDVPKDERDYKEEIEKPLPKPKKKKPKKEKVVRKEEREEDFGSEEIEDTLESEEDNFISDISQFNKQSEQSLKDVLKNENIPETFELDKSYLAPEDFPKIRFSTQIPEGYDMGEITAFVRMVKESVSYYIDLLNQRNNHVTKLASIVDQLIVDNNNLRFQNEAAQGISIMSSSDTDELEEENTRLKIENEKLQKQVRNFKNTSDNGSEKRITDLQNTISLMRRENEDLNSTIADLRVRIAELEEEGFDFNLNSSTNSNKTSGFAEIDDNGENFGLEEGESNIDTLPEDDLILPEEDELLPEDDDVDFNSSNSRRVRDYSVSSNFIDDEDESLDDFLEAHQGDFSQDGDVGDDLDFSDKSSGRRR